MSTLTFRPWELKRIGQDISKLHELLRLPVFRELDLVDYAEGTVHTRRLRVLGEKGEGCGRLGSCGIRRTTVQRCGRRRNKLVSGWGRRCGL